MDKEQQELKEQQEEEEQKKEKELDLDSLMKRAKEGNIPTIEEIYLLNEQAMKLFRTYPNVVQVTAPVTLCGDIHGQFDDLLELFNIGGEVPFTSYVFMGDYVDRGLKSIETIVYLFALKLKYPSYITLLRGNHESLGTSYHFGFRDEIMKRYGDESVWRVFLRTFNTLPLAALISEKILCVHGGLSPNIKEIKDINSLDRFVEIPREGPMCDLTWGDPSNIEGFQPSVRDAGYMFGADVTRAWNEKNGLLFTARAHQLVSSGIEFGHDGQIVTIFSAPDYCMRCGNKAGIMEIDENLNRREIRFGTTRLKNGNDEIPEYFSVKAN
ncbi:Metallo-dependent phosphatase-like protein [Histomonas meleagridis]|uniref:Metallo-dependent phosphatase-like protein n=1 Tax=Histomonas meleagridis TaxID=135588 RepID=UPI0035597DE2|nr:Metallo-dependent phosphatase-like protein [Histomonas meleagridis]KAH0805104.1 Metallo-dependent phosphatase-like protein [Histomonas meleagridis]